MKKILIVLGIVAIIGCLLLIFTVYKAGKIILKAQGQSLYSGAGAWSRIQEYAQEQGNTKYIAEAERSLKFLEDNIKEWRENAQAVGLDVNSFEKMRDIAYETTDRNIKNGQNPLEYLDRPQPEQSDESPLK
jgi:hypothetical protein